LPTSNCANYPRAAARITYEQLLETIFTDCTSRRRSGVADEERFCSSVVTAVVPVVLVVAVVVVVVDPDELEAGASCPVTVILCPTWCSSSLDEPSSFH